MTLGTKMYCTFIFIPGSDTKNEVRLGYVD